MNKIQLAIAIILGLGLVLAIMDYKERRDLRELMAHKAKCTCNGDHHNDVNSHYDVPPTQLDVL